MVNMTSMLRILPLGGLGEIGKNMTVFEYEDDIIIVDAGVMFPENDMLGVDLIIPDYHYLMEEGRLEKIRAILITHGHEDHIGALPHLVEDIKAPIYATPLTRWSSSPSARARYPRLAPLRSSRSTLPTAFPTVSASASPRRPG